LKASQTFGPGSKEARVAWDAVEEINSSDNSAAIGNKPEGNDQGNSPTKEYTELLTNLDFLVSEYGEKIEQIKSLATKLKATNMIIQKYLKESLQIRLKNLQR